MSQSRVSRLWSSQAVHRGVLDSWTIIISSFSCLQVLKVQYCAQILILLRVSSHVQVVGHLARVWEHSEAV